ncbi:thiamine-phosphate diphosphorylase [Stackebrandtia endophytica]|uniref:Thiamine-phosphate synthase n=1 Tax=Stackebrandtia endophytica TaxID=1496996 RepID=A0A543B058_9ACTN|nr:thiamine phosphate synthase [Stackebrandtia endophytica]TQL78222.1 thiamine-phosphate diphosphorylase [Stackebrandtia endophytica]
MVDRFTSPSSSDHDGYRRVGPSPSRVARWGRLHIITDTRPGCDPIRVTEAALSAGAPVIQVRFEGHYTDREAFDLAEVVAELCRAHDATCLINDRLDIALAVGAHGGHLGQRDLPVSVARRILPADAVIGATSRDPHSARAQQRAGAGYLGVGPAHRSPTKPDLPDPLGVDRIGELARSVDIPVIAIGGVTVESVPGLLAAGAFGVAVVGAVSRAADPYAATRRLLEVLDEC